MNAMNAMRRALLFLGALACHHEGKEETASPILVRRGIAPRQELDDAIGRADGARAAVHASVSAEDLARRTLGRVQVRASVAGIVTHVWRGPGGWSSWPTRRSASWPK